MKLFFIQDQFIIDVLNGLSTEEIKYKSHSYMEISTVQLLRLPVTNTNVMEQWGPETILMTCIGLISGISKLILLLILMS